MNHDVVPLGNRLSLDDFLCFDGPWGIAAETDSKATFMSQLGLSERCALHRTIYSHMEKEAQRACQQLCYDPDALLPNLRDRGTVEPPWRTNEIQEEAFQKATLKLYRTASAQTQSLYALVGGEEDNWVIRWMLWHAIEGMPTPKHRQVTDDEGVKLEQSFPTPVSCADDFRSHRLQREEEDGDGDDARRRANDPNRLLGFGFESLRATSITDNNPFDDWYPPSDTFYKRNLKPPSTSRRYWDPCRNL